VSAGGRIRGKN